MATSLESFGLNDGFTPSTPHVHKFRTEMCKNWELYGKCKYGDEVSIHSILFYMINFLNLSNFDENVHWYIFNSNLITRF